MLDIEILPALSDNYIYLLRDPVSGETAVIDPAEAEPVLEALERNDWRLNYVLNTHHHGDHVGANLLLKQITGCQVMGAAADQSRIPGIDRTLAEGDHVALGGHTLRVIETPGHTLGHIVYYCATSQALFCGDTLFSLGCGRLFEGSAEQLYQSLQTLSQLPADTQIYCAHEYTEANGRFALTLDAENPALQRRLDEVAKLRRQNLPTLPSSIALELATNPFLRTSQSTIRAAIGATTASPDNSVFAAIRRLKDDFR